MTAQKQLIDSAVRHAVHIEGLKTGEANQFAAFLKRIDLTIRQQLLKHDLTAFSRARLEKLLKSVDSALAGIFTDHYDELTNRMADFAEYEAEFEAKSLKAATGAAIVVPTIQRVRSAVRASPLSVRGADGGKLLDPFIKDWQAVERKRLTGAIRQGWFEGQTTNQILQKVRGTRKNGFRDGILAITNRNAESVVRTSVQHVANSARAEVWAANDDVKAYRIVATLDSRTSTICRSLDGRVYKKGKGPMPPFHINCRTATVPELDGRKYEKLKAEEKRASKDGPVNANQTYYEWLKTQSAAFQDDVLGKTRAKLFRDGQINAERFARLSLDKNFKPLTLAEMRKREPLAFERAGL